MIKINRKRFKKLCDKHSYRHKFQTVDYLPQGSIARYNRPAEGCCYGVAQREDGICMDCIIEGDEIMLPLVEPPAFSYAIDYCNDSEEFHYIICKEYIKRENDFIVNAINSVDDITHREDLMKQFGRKFNNSILCIANDLSVMLDQEEENYLCFSDLAMSFHTRLPYNAHFSLVSKYI